MTSTFYPCLLHTSSRLFCLLVLLLAAPALSRAQTTPVPTASALPFPVLTRADTARAVHELFRSRRGGGAGWLAFGTAGLLGSTLPALQTTSAGVWTPGVVAGSAFFLIGLNKRIQFRRSREKQVLRELAATGHLPHSVSRRLRGLYAPLHGTTTAPDKLSDFETDASAPGAPAPAPLLSPAQQLADARQDTLDAVLGLFMAKRLGGQLPLVLALPGLRLMTGATKTPSSPYAQPQRSEPSTGQVAAGLALAAGGLFYMLAHNAPYTNARFEALRTDYLAGQPLPAAIRTRLKPRHLASGRSYREKLERRAARRHLVSK